MEAKKLILKCRQKSNENSRIEIFSNDERCSVSYIFATKEIKIFGKSSLSLYLKRNISQLRKVLGNRNGRALQQGFCLNFIIRDYKDVEAFNNPDNIIVWDNRDGNEYIFPLSKGDPDCISVYTDACYLPQKSRAGIAFIICHDAEREQQFAKAVEASDNCFCELLAAHHALLKCKANKIRIISDSVYVRKGLTEWMPNWQLNNWLTASGKPAQNIDAWKNFKKVAGKRYIEFQWIKGHSGQKQNVACDILAGKAAKEDIILGF